MFDTTVRDSDAILAERLGINAATLEARHLLNSGVDGYFAGDIDGAARDFKAAQTLASACCVTRNTARIYRAVVMFTKHWPGEMRIPEEAGANERLLVDAERLYRAVLGDSPNEDQRKAAEQGLRTLRQ